jgi:hypothetical protein
VKLFSFELVKVRQHSEMHTSVPICLTFGDEVPQSIRPRITYAFRVYAAIFGHAVIEEKRNAPAGMVFFKYGGAGAGDNITDTVEIPWRYRPRGLAKNGRKPIRHRFLNEDVFLSHGIDPQSGRPDWLAEIFEWLSSSYEADIVGRDGVGRIPYSEMIFTRQGVSACKPHAMIFMSWLEHCLLKGQSDDKLPRAPSPIPGVEHLVVCSHDVDFYPADMATTFVRLFKNLGISYHTYRSWSYFRSNLRMMAGLLGGKTVGDYLPPLLDAGRKDGFSSTVFVVPRRAHRRDPNYKLDNLSSRFADVRKEGFRVALQGSYTSVVESEDLSSEANALEDVVGTKTLGGRQHWLRFDRHEKLFSSVERAQLQFDSTLGFAEMVGFRNGASFAFPPYDMENERPYEFLEIPLVLMDGNLEAACRSRREDPQELADAVLGESRRWGWGGIAALWHNPVEPLAVPEEINRVFWRCVKARGEHRETWLSAEEFMTKSLHRYQNAGLLKKVRLDA